ncbi:NTP transferase domain-containing protein [Pseudomonas sp. NA-150]|uniref:nucleotidyltransferase family protein n=1 Tax=Pseudomonas sp. NA-150 TaxID=3367525 RepID=UPI0037CCAD56
MSASLCAIVLAAGQGSRYREVAGADQDKLLAPCVGRDGVVRPVLEQVLLNVANIVDQVVLLARPECHAVIELGQRYACRVELLESAGMGDSIAAAVTAEPDHRGWLVVLGDMPFILPETLSFLVESLDDDHICVPVYNGALGHPVAFGRRFCLPLMALSGDRGAKRLFQPELVRQIEVNDPGVLWDVDVPEALLFNP